MKRSAWPVVVASAITALLLCALGGWQLMRLSEKNVLLADIESRGAAPIITLEQAMSESEAGTDLEYRRIEASGTFLANPPLMMLAVYEGGPGFRAIGALVGDGGIFVLVDRGLLPEAARADVLARKAEGPVLLRGVIRTRNGEQGIFDPENDAAGNLWHWWDVPAMQAALAAPTETRIAPFVIELAESPFTDEFPKAQLAAAAIKNNHLQYAMTWFALAIVAVVMALLVLRRRAGQ
ncbi:MAG: SURF1 family protein [Aestuariivirga sp.]